MSDVSMDFQRIQRCGIAEAVFCEFKRPDQIEQILAMAQQSGHRLLLTRLNAEKLAQISEQWTKLIHYNPIARCAVFGDAIDFPAHAHIGVVSGGSSDQQVCEEIRMTLQYHGIACDLHQDLGVAGLWRLQERLPLLRKYSIIIAVAGMEAALPTIVSGLLDAPIIAVPTSVGYGVSAGGHTALNACLSSCSGGVMTMNIDNGYGAATAAIRIYNQIIHK